MSIAARMCCLILVLLICSCDCRSTGSLEPATEEWLFAGTVSVESWKRVSSELESRDVDFVIDTGTMPAVMVRADDLDIASRILAQELDTSDVKTDPPPEDDQQR